MRPALLILAAAVVAGVAACAKGREATPRLALADTATDTMTDTTTVVSTGGVDVLTASDLARAADALARGGITGRTIAARTTLKYVESRRVRDGSPEIHDHWADVTFVQAGRATLLTGGRVTGSRLESDGEHRGGTMQGAASRVIGPGDFIMIPAGVAHQYNVAAGDSLRYLTIKVR